MCLGTLVKIFRCIGTNDIVTIQSSGRDKVLFRFSSEEEDKVSDYEMRLMNLDIERLGIPEVDYDAVVKMPSVEFQRVVRDLGLFGESTIISVNKQGIKFSGTGDLGVANVKLAQFNDVDNEDNSITIDIQEPVSLTFATR